MVSVCLPSDALSQGLPSYFLLPWMWGNSSQLLQQSTAQISQICWHIERSTFTASSFRICNSSVRVSSGSKLVLRVGRDATQAETRVCVNSMCIGLKHRSSGFPSFSNHSHALTPTDFRLASSVPGQSPFLARGCVAGILESWVCVAAAPLLHESIPDPT